MRCKLTDFKEATVANQRLLHEVISRDANSYSDDLLLQPGSASPASAMIEAEAKRRGYQSKPLKNHLEVWRDEKLLGVFSPTSPNLTIATRMITKQYSRVKQVLQLAALAVPPGRVFTDLAPALTYFRSCRAPQAVKPAGGSGSKRVTAGIEDETLFVTAWQLATVRGKAIVEDFIVGDELHMIVLGGKVVAAVCHLPAFVVGDGKSSIRELVAEKNLRRQQNPLTCAYPIERFDYMEQVSRRSLDDIPFVCEYVRLSTVSSVTRGGEAVSLFDVLHPSFFELARRVHAAVPGATLLGLTVIASNFGTDAFTDNAVVIEVNSDPDIATPRFAAYGQPAENIAGKLLDFAERQFNVRRFLKERESKAQLMPAPVYRAPCGGDSFPRSYGIQMRLLRQAAFARGLRVEMVDFETTIISDERQRHLFYQGMSDGTLAAARRATNDKEWTRQLLKRAGVSVPQGQVFAPSDWQAGWTFACELGLPVVIKPLSGSGGKGVSTNIRSLDHFRDAWRYAVASERPMIIVESHYEGSDFRVFVVGQRLVAAAQRIPAHVVGDGKHSIEELIVFKNDLRKFNPHHGAKPITLTPAILRNLGETGLTPASIPDSGQHVLLHTVANIGGGGESVDVTEQVHPDWAEIAVKTRKAVYDPPHVGLDLIAEDIALPPGVQRWAVVEVNSNPDFGANHFPMRGPGRNVAGVLLEHLFSGQPLVAVQIGIQGKVQKVGYRQWFWKEAHLRDLCGWVRNLPDGSVEAVIGGKAFAVEDMIAKCRQGPARAKVEHVLTESWCDTLPEGFEMRI